MTYSNQAEEQLQLLTDAHRNYGKMLSAHAFFKIQNQETGKDLVQETFIKTWKYLIKGGNVTTMKAFLYHVLNNLIVDEYRKHKTTSLDTLSKNGLEPPADDSDRLFDQLDGKAAVVLIKRLPARYQKVIELRYVQDLPLREIARVVGQTKNAVAVQIHRGLKKLRQLYEPV